MSFELSICIPTYNGIEKLKYTLPYILENIDQDKIQLCISDNGSTDGSQDYLIELSRKHKNVKTFFFDENMGIAINYAKALKIGDGRYLWLMGNDDNPVFQNFDRITEFLNANQYDLVFINVTEDRKEYITEASKEINFTSFITTFIPIGAWISTYIFSKALVSEYQFPQSKNAFPHVQWALEILAQKKRGYWLNISGITENKSMTCNYDDKSVQYFIEDLSDTIWEYQNVIPKNTMNTSMKNIASIMLKFKSILGFRAKGGLTFRKLKHSWKKAKRYPASVRLKLIISVCLPRNILAALYTKVKKQ